MYTLVLLRHGESTWNLANRFSGWTDVDLTPAGRAQARAAGARLRDGGFEFDMAFTSVLKRAIRTLWIALDEMDRMWIPVHRDWRLNERHYGALQGLNKAQTAARYGENQVLKWRRSYDEPPPALAVGDERHPEGDPRYAGVPSLPRTECLKDTVERMMPLWLGSIAPQVRAGERVLVVRARQLASRPREAPWGDLRRKDPRGEHPDRGAARLRARRRASRDRAPLPRRSGGDRCGHASGRGAGEGGKVTDPVPGLTFEEFQRVRIHAGTIVEAAPNPRARVPAYVLRIDFGPLGMRTSSAQITRNYALEELVGRQIVAVLNFPPKRVAGVKSEVLVLGTVSEEDGVVLLHPMFPVANGALVG